MHSSFVSGGNLAVSLEEERGMSLGDATEGAWVYLEPMWVTNLSHGTRDRFSPRNVPFRVLVSKKTK